MNMPPFLLLGALLFWGWQVDLVITGAVLGMLLESRNLVQGRWEFTAKEFARLWDLCTLLFLAEALYVKFSEEVTNPAYKFFQWFPLVFFPMVFGVLFSTREAIPFKVFSWYLRKKNTEAGSRTIQFAWIYFAVCLIAAGASNARDRWYYSGLTIVTGIAIAWVRPRRFRIWTWAASFGLAVCFGFYGQAMMQNFQAMMEGRASEWFSRWARKDFDPLESKTSIGRIGNLKGSSRVVMRVTPEAGEVPRLLRQSSYTSYREGAWRAYNKSFVNVALESDTTTWTLDKQTNLAQVVKVATRMPKRGGLISLPLNAAQILDLPVNEVKTNSLGTAQALDAPTMVAYKVKFGMDHPLEMAPAEHDLDVGVERELIFQVVHQLGVPASFGPEQRLKAVADFFAKNFTYRTYQKASEIDARSPLTSFLLKTHAGHCEYFATATVLMLRELGVPARYATGYSVQESSESGKSYLVRDRHAHAWALVWLKNEWINVDNTPGGWSEAESKEASSFQKLDDWWSNFTFVFLEWRWLGQKGIVRKVAPWLLIPLSLFMAWRIFGRKLQTTSTKRTRDFVWPGKDSEFYLIERQLIKSGLAREPWETQQQWVKRLSSSERLHPELLEALLRSHYRYRFDPAGIDSSERDRLRNGVSDWLRARRN